MYDLGDQLLMVASDRVSTYDVVLPTPIPDKGKVLTGLSVFWFGRTEDIVPNHLLSTDVPDEARGRGLLVRKLEIFPVECVVRGYLSGSGWKEYKQTPGRVRHRAAGRAARVRPPAGADLHPRHEGRAGRPRRERRLRPRRRDRRRPRHDGGAAAPLARGLRARGRARREPGHHPGRHQVRVRARRRTAASCSPTRCSRRTPRGSGPPTSTSRAAASPPSTSSTCATGSTRPGGTTRRPAPSCRPTSCRPRAPSTSRRTSASPASRSSAGSDS